MAASEINKSNTRILYIEPNDVYDNSLEYDGIHSLKSTQITPKYEDLCISFNLLIEKFSRLSKNGLTGNGRYNNSDYKTYSIQWFTTLKEKNGNGVSSSQGSEGNFLTTYYTEIDFDSYKKKTQIEGLGVESVQISYESWYTPTVVIKFVDVRGSAIFGREEAIHVDETMTVDNIFGAFFTMPYPRFKLQVKGFYGKPVTFQLTCSNFKGNLNAQTGNFEATVTFIAYSWSLMTEIPFMYLVAAPNATYIGEDYWNRNVGKKAWQLYDVENVTIQPPKLDEMFEKIKNATKFIDDNIEKATQEQAKQVSDFDKEKTLLREIRQFFQNFKSQIGTKITKEGGYYFGSDIENENAEESNKKKNYQMVLFSVNEKFEFDDALKKTISDLYDKLEKYGKDYTNVIDESFMPNGWKKDEVESLTFFDFLYINEEEGQRKITVKGLDKFKNAQDLKSVKLNDSKTLGDANAKKLYDLLVNEDKNLQRYVYVIDCKYLQGVIDERQKFFDSQSTALLEQVNNEIQERIVELIGFKPYIGNVFKIIFCHVETFCHILFDSAETIYNQMSRGERTASHLHIQSIDEWGGTDFNFKDVGDIGPWPAIYNKGIVGAETGYESNVANVMGWPGDFDEHLFVEEKVVYSLQEGIERLVERLSEKGKIPEEIIKFLHIPASPFEFKNRANPFVDAIDDGMSDLAGHLAIRAAGMLGVGCSHEIGDKYAELLGKMDACNFYIASAGNASKINSVYFNGLNAVGSKLEDVLYGISICDNKYDDQYAMLKSVGNGENTNQSRHSFETATFRTISKYGINPIIKLRHPMFFEHDDGVLQFMHWYDNDNNGNGKDYTPTKLSKKWTTDYNQFSVNSFNEGSNHYYYVTPRVSEKNEALDWLYYCDTEALSFVDDKDTFINEYMFGIIKNQGVIKGITEKVEELKSGTVNASNYEFKDDKLSEFVKEFYKVDMENRMSFYTPTTILTRKINDLDKDFKIDNSKLIGDYRIFTNIRGSITKDSVKVSKENGLTDKDGKSISIDDVVIDVPSFKCSYKDNTVSYQSLFFEPFFYLQNAIKDKKQRLYAKAILFLNSLFVGYNYKLLSVFTTGVGHGCVQTVPIGYLLLIGALLWRQKQSDDVIIYKHDANEFQKVSINDTFLIWPENKQCEPYVPLHANGSIGRRYRSVENFIGCKVDMNIRNQLISLFEKFVDNEFGAMLDLLELKTLKGGLLTDKEINSYIEDIKNVAKYERNPPSTDTSTSTNTDDSQNLQNEIEEKRKEIQNLIKGKYLSLYLDSKDCVYLKLTETGEIQNKLKGLYYDCYCIYDSLHRHGGFDNNHGQIRIKEDVYKKYLKGFSDELGKIAKGGTVQISGEVNMNISSTTYQNRDLSISIYYYIKNLWDKWLSASKSDAFDVENYFTNFIFIDSFYRNTYSKLAINCQVLIDAFTRLEDNASLFSFIGKIITKHKCILLPVPDYIGFNYDDQTTNELLMKELFRPLPYNDMPSPSNNNKFVCIYTHNPATHASEDNYFKNDSFDIWSRNENGNYQITPTAQALFKYETQSYTDDDKLVYNATRYGYFVPSFGVSFARQQNHLFKNMSVTMDNPVMTEQSILAQWNIALKGSSSGKSVCFTGQDTFNVFTNYSYSVDVEMMGNAQICPLMYFQFLNVPMWRGTYMIYKVTHTMTPGNMVTKFTGMKMSKYCKPFNVNFYTVIKSIKIEKPSNILIDPDCLKYLLENGSLSSDSSSSSGDSTNVGYTGTVTNEKARRVLSWVDFFYWAGTKKYYTTGNTGRKGGTYTIDGKTVNVTYRNKWHWCAGATMSRFSFCTGLQKHFSVWSPRDYPTSTHKNVIPNFNSVGWKLVSHSAKNAESIKYYNDPKNLRPCDVCVMFAIKGGNTAHVCMWTGEYWVSDMKQTKNVCQNGFWCYGDGPGRDGDYSILLFRHPDFQEPGQTVIEVT